MVDTTLPLEVKWTSFILLGEGRSHNAAQATEPGQATEPAQATRPGLRKPGSLANKRKNLKLWSHSKLIN